MEATAGAGLAFEGGTDGGEDFFVDGVVVDVADEGVAVGVCGVAAALIIWGAYVDDLAGLEKFPRLENLANISAGFVSLAPLKGVKRLTHAHLHGGMVTDLSLLSTLNELRELWLGTKKEKVDLTPLAGLPKLHGLNVKRGSQELPGVSEFRKKLSGWDIEFQAEKPRHMASTRLTVVSQEEFDRFDIQEPFGRLPSDGNYQLLESELEWLQDRIETSFASEFKEHEDYNIPHQWGEARSTTIVLLRRSDACISPPCDWHSESTRSRPQ